MSRSDRTPAEREQARLEREAKRAAREGRTPQPPPPVERPPDVQPPSEPASEPPPLPEPPAEPVHQEPVAEPESVQPPPEPDPVPVRHEPMVEPEPYEEPHGEHVPPQPPPPYEPPSAEPTSRRGAAARRPAADRRKAASEFLRGRREQRGGRSTPGSGSRRPRVLIAAALAGALALVCAWFLLSLFQPFKGDGSGEVTVTIPKGATVGEIADQLADAGVIDSPFFFRARATLSGRAGDLKAGRFVLRGDMSSTAAMDALAEAPVPDTVTITIPEGMSRSEAKRVVGDSLKGDYLAASRRSQLLDPKRYGGRKAENLEGFLFPATYELKPGRPVSELVAQQLQAFRRELAKVNMRFAKSKNLTPYDVLTIASMVEREAQLPRERPLVASVIYNRLRDGIPLGIDATTRFATGNWTEPLKESELALDSPYNTRSRQGLPPGPIGSPGLAAMKAAANPAKTDYLYYVVKPGACGEHAFSTSFEQFDQDVARYNSERAARGGKSPTDC